MSGQANFGPVDGPGILPVRQPAVAAAWVFSAAGAVIMTDEVRYSQNAARTLGIEPNRVLSGAEWLKQIHPDDRPSVMACLHAVRPDNPLFSTTFRYTPQDGDREVWLEQIAIAEFDSAGQRAITVGAGSLPEHPARLALHKVDCATHRLNSRHREMTDLT